MSPAASILVIAATDRELPAGPWRTLVSGVGPVDAAAATAAELERRKPAAVLHVGIAGARRASGIAVGSIVIGGEARYCDLSVPAKWAPSVLGAAPNLLAAAQRAVPDARTCAIGTSASVGGTLSSAPSAGAGAVDVEAMEGFAVLRAAALAGVPAIEVRVISNEIEETDRARWQFDQGFARIAEITPALVDEMARALETNHA